MKTTLKTTESITAEFLAECLPAVLYSDQTSADVICRLIDEGPVCVHGLLKAYHRKFHSIECPYGLDQLEWAYALLDEENACFMRIGFPESCEVVKVFIALNFNSEGNVQNIRYYLCENLKGYPVYRKILPNGSEEPLNSTVWAEDEDKALYEDYFELAE